MVNTMMMMDDMMVRALDPADPAICGIQVIYDTDLMPMTDADADAQAQARGDADLTPLADAYDALYAYIDFRFNAPSAKAAVEEHRRKNPPATYTGRHYRDWDPYYLPRTREDEINFTVMMQTM